MFVDVRHALMRSTLFFQQNHVTPSLEPGSGDDFKLAAFQKAPGHRVTGERTQSECSEEVGWTPMGTGGASARCQNGWM